MIAAPLFLSARKTVLRRARGVWGASPGQLGTPFHFTGGQRPLIP